MNFFKVQDEKRTFQSPEMKNENHAKFRNENNSLTYFLLFNSLVSFLNLVTLSSFLFFIYHLIPKTGPLTWDLRDS